MQFSPVCLEEDRPAVLAARQLYDRRVRAIYEQHSKLCRLAANKKSDALRKAVTVWLNRVEMVAATDFDIVHFRAQIKRNKSLGKDFRELGETLNLLQERNSEARADLPAAEQKLKEIHASISG